MKKRILSFLLAVSLVATSGVGLVDTTAVMAAEVDANANTITSMSYYPGNGPDYSATTLDAVSFGFVMPVFNGGSASFSDVSGDLGIDVLVDGEWMDIDAYDGLIYNSSWGHWYDAGFTGLWFRISETQHIRMYAKSNPSVHLDYNLTVNKANANQVTGLANNCSFTISANRSGTGFVNFPNAITPLGSIKTSADTFKVLVKPLGAPDSDYVDIGNNPDSGWIYDKNFGFEEYGMWITVDEMGSVNVKYELKENPSIYQVYAVTYSETKRDNYKVYANGATTITAGADNGSCGIVFPNLGGNGNDNLPTSKELGKFVIEMQLDWNREWVDFTDASQSDWFYSGNGYSDLSSKNQWGYFDDYVYGIWLQPVQQDMKIRIGFPKDGEKGGEIGDNYIEYTIIGAPNAYRPKEIVVNDIDVDMEGTNADIEGWTLIDGDEFSGNALDMNKWNYNTGFLIDPSEPGTAGWGNAELEYYTDSTENIFVQDGNLHLVAKKSPKTFICTDKNQTKVQAEYASGKITSKDKMSFTYGRIDFRAKAPAGTGLWPALWMLPNDDTYGTWAASGEIDVMECRGSKPWEALGTLHYGGKWPNNRNVGGTYIFPDGTTYDDGYHIYSCVWEEDNITFYVDGHFYKYIPKDKWYSESSNKDTAPFDVDFYVIMNLAVGGNFDGGNKPSDDFTSAEMLVDYVRIYKAEGSAELETVPVESLELTSSVSELFVGQTAEITKKFTPANTTQKNVIWTSSDERVATVSAGQVTAVGEGTAVITATSVANPSVKATYLITVRLQIGGADPDPEPITEYAITYKLNGGVNHKSNPATYDSSVDVPLYNPTKTGYTFGGWYTESTFKNKVTSISAGETEAKIVYAKWIANTYNVAFNANGGKGKMKSKTGMKYGATYKLPTNTFSRKGYKFAGWSTTKTGKVKYKNKASVKNLTSTNKKTITLYAVWTKVKTPAKAVITKYTTGKGTFTIKYKAISGITGYQIQYSTSAKFKSAKTAYSGTKTTLSVKKLKKKKTYYVRVRAYTKDSTGKVYYGKWSAVKK